MVVVGYIARRRSLGKYLAFADVLEGEEEDSQQEKNRKLWKVVFEKNSCEWQGGDNFPTKATHLPYGAKVSMDLCSTPTMPTNSKTKQGQSSDGNYRVQRWTLLVDPRRQALTDAAARSNVEETTNTESESSSRPKNEGIVCSTYLQARRQTFFKFNETSKNNGLHAVRSKKKSLTTKNPLEKDDDEESPHGDKRFKTYRGKMFAEWLIAKYYDEDTLQHASPRPTVLDVAGGKGKLAIELAVQGNLSCTIIDPLIRKHGKKLEPKDAKRIRNAQAPHPILLNTFFNQESFLQEYGDLVEDASLLLGLHPDECTEDIVDVALKYNKPVAVVPCCTFAGFFPFRHLADGTPVRTYEQFLTYLLEKDSRLKMETLPFQGKNIVVYLSKETPEAKRKN